MRGSGLVRPNDAPGAATIHGPHRRCRAENSAARRGTGEGVTDRASRRQFLALTLPALAIAQETPARRLRIVCVGGHPDDPESGCGGTLARYASLGHTVAIVYLTRGEAGVAGKS